MRKKNRELYGLQIEASPYNEIVDVMWGDPHLMQDYIFEKYGQEKVKNYEFFGGYCFTPDPEEYEVPALIYLGKKKTNWSIITHEVLHYCIAILHSRGVTISGEWEHHEPLTYLVQYFINIIQNTPTTQWYLLNEKKMEWKKQRNKNGKNKKDTIKNTK